MLAASFRGLQRVCLHSCVVGTLPTSYTQPRTYPTPQVGGAFGESASHPFHTSSLHKHSKRSMVATLPPVGSNRAHVSRPRRHTATAQTCARDLCAPVRLAYAPTDHQHKLATHPRVPRAKSSPLCDAHSSPTVRERSFSFRAVGCLLHFECAGILPHSYARRSRNKEHTHPQHIDRAANKERRRDEKAAGPHCSECCELTRELHWFPRSAGAWCVNSTISSRSSGGGTRWRRDRVRFAYVCEIEYQPDAPRRYSVPPASLPLATKLVAAWGLWSRAALRAAAGAPTAPTGKVWRTVM